MNIGKLVEQLHHAVIILEGMQAHQGRRYSPVTNPCRKLMLVPEKNQTQAGMAGKVSLAWEFAHTGARRSVAASRHNCEAGISFGWHTAVSVCGRWHLRYTKDLEMPEIPIPAAFDRPTLLSDQDLYLFNRGSNYRMHETMGAHLVTRDQKSRRHVQRLGAECAIAR